MTLQVLSFHWKAIRAGMIPLMIAAFGLPILSVQGLGPPPAGLGEYYAFSVVAGAELWVPSFPVLAAVSGFVVALSAWAWDHGVGHVYPLSLPVARWEYALIKMGAGVVLLLAPAAAFFAGALAASLSISLPPGLQAYPLDLSLRFLMASLLVYALAFAMAAGTKRTAFLVLSVALGTLVGGELLLDVLGWLDPAFQGRSLAPGLFRALVGWPGPLQVLFGNWMLIDV